MSVSDQILELIRESSPALVTRMKDIVDIIRKEVYDFFVFVFDLYEDMGKVCTQLDIEDDEFKTEVLDIIHDSGRYCQIAGLHLVQTYLSYVSASIEDFDKILNILVIKLATTVLTSDISLSLQALDVLSNILDQHEDKIKSESK